MIIKYDRQDDGLYMLDIKYDSGATALDGPLDRKAMVEAICRGITESKPDRVGIAFDEQDKPMWLHPRTVKDIIEGKRTAADLTIVKEE